MIEPYVGDPESDRGPRPTDFPVPIVLGERGRLIHAYESGAIERIEEAGDGDPCFTKCGRRSWWGCLATLNDQLDLRVCRRCGPIPVTVHCVRCGTRFAVSDLDSMDTSRGAVHLCVYCEDQP